MSDLAKRSDWNALAQPASTQSPLLMLPADIRPAIARLWMCNAHLPNIALALCSTIRVYLDTCTLTPEDAEIIVSRLLAPDRRALHRFASDLLCDLSQMVAELVKAKRAAAERGEFRERIATWEREAAVKVCDLFKTPE